MREMHSEIFKGRQMDEAFESALIDCTQLLHGGLQCSWTGTPTGALRLEVSCDKENPTAWSTLADSEHAVAGAPGSHYYSIENMTWRWLRVVYDFTSGDGLLTTNGQFRG